MPQRFNQAANSWRSGVKAWKVRTGWGSRSAGTATKCSLLPISIPAALGWIRGRLWKCTLFLLLFCFLRIAFDCFNKWGRLGPAAESVYKTLQRGRASLFSLQAATKQITAKAHGTMLANGHKGTKQASVLACRSRSERIMRARTTKPKFLAQVT